MSGISTSLSIGVQALMAQESALQVTNNNIANANTPGYTRELVNFSEAPPNGPNNLGTGVVLQGYDSVRDELLQGRIEQQSSQQGGANAQLGSLQQVQPVFAASTQDIGSQFSKFFTSVSALSNNPANASSRQAVLSSGQNLVAAFHSAASGLAAQQTSLDSRVKQDVVQINNLTAQIASVSGQITQAKGAGQNTGILQDQQDQLVLSLSKLTDVSVTHTEGGDTLTTGNGTALVSGDKSYALQTTTGSDGSQHVLASSGSDITATLSGGDLGGSIQIRTVAIPALQTKLDTLASEFAGAFNAAQAQGYDANGAVGQKLFTVPAAVQGSAAGIAMASNNTAAIAASSDGSSGSNGNIQNLSAVQTTALSSGQNPTDAYSGIVFQVGTLTSNAESESTATTASLLQLNDQRASVSGVSIDEESTNLIRYQQAYQAAARIITTVNTLIAITMSMGTAAGA